MTELEKALKDVGIDNPDDIGLSTFNELGKPEEEIILEGEEYHNFSDRKIEKILKKSLFIFKNVV